MTYCNVQDLIDRCGSFAIVQLSNPDDSQAEGVNEPVVNRAILDACGEMDGYIAARYTLPLVETTDQLRTLAIDLALYRLAKLGRLGEVPEGYKDSKDDAIRFLRDMVKGQATLGLNQTVEPTTQTLNVSSAPRQFGRGNLGGF
jgi:phage gp36-like protein